MQEPYSYEKGMLIVSKKIELLALDLVEKRLVTNQIVLSIGYDIEYITNPKIYNNYFGEETTDHYGRKVPKSVHGSINLKRCTSSTRIIRYAVIELYERIVDKNLLIRRVNIGATHIKSETDIEEQPEQLNLFKNYMEALKETAEEQAALVRERKIQETVLSVHKKYGKNALLKGMNLEQGATTKERNNQIGGYKK